MPGSTGAAGIMLSIKELKKKIKRREDFSVKIIFSSVSMSTFSDWMEEKFVDTNSAYTSTYPVTHLAWSQPEGPGYTADCDETIFVDCSSNQAAYFKASEGGEDALRSYISFAFARLADIIYRRTEEGHYGVVHPIILAYHPCQKCLFALSELMGNSLEYSGVYSSFVSDIICRDEYFFILRWLQSLGWRFQVDYCGVFDPYKAEGEDQKGDAERAKEMKAILDAYPSEEKYSNIAGGNLMFDSDSWVHDREKFRNRKDVTERDRTFYINYEGQEYTIEQLREKHRKIVDPTPEEMEANLEKMEKAQKEKEKKAKRRKKVIRKAIDDNNEYQVLRDDYELSEISYLRDNSSKYDKDVQGWYEADRDLVNAGIQNRNWGIPIDGHYESGIALSAEIDSIDRDVAEGKKQIEDYEKAIADKRKAIKSQRIGAIQILVAIASIPFPALAIVDIVLTVYQWGDPTKASTKDNILNTAGIAFDIAGLIPYFGTVFRMAKTSKLAKPLKSDVHLIADADIEKMNSLRKMESEKVESLRKVDSYNNSLKEKDAAIDETLSRLDDIFDNWKLEGELKKSQQAFERMRMSPEAKRAAIEAENRASLEHAKLIRDNATNVEEISKEVDAAFDSIMRPKGSPPFTGEPITDLEKEFLIKLDNVGEGNTLSAIRILTGGESMSTALMKLLPIRTVSSNFKNASSFLDWVNAFGDLFVRLVGVGWNGAIWIKNETENNTPLTEEEAKRRDEQVNALMELDAAQKAQAEAKQALKEAKTKEEREAAQKALDEANKRIDSVSGALDIDLNNYQSSENAAPLQASSVDAYAELNKAEDDEKQAKRALRKAKTPEEKAAAQKALDNARQRKEAARNAVNAQYVEDNIYSEDELNAINSRVAESTEQWEAAAKNVNSEASRQYVVENYPRQIENEQILSLDDNPYEAMVDAERLKALNSSYNQAAAAAAIDHHNYDYFVAKKNEEAAYDQAIYDSSNAFDAFMIGVESDFADQDLRRVLEQQKKEEEGQPHP